MNASACLKMPAHVADDPILAILPGGANTPVVSDLPMRDLDWWLDKTEEFAAEYLDIRSFRLREKFDIPSFFPWKQVLPVFDPSGLATREAISAALRYQGLDVWGGVADRGYDGCGGSNVPTLHFIELSTRPNEDMMDKTAEELRASQEQFLTMRGYVLAYGLYWFAVGRSLAEDASGSHFDEDTWTLFPDDRLPGPGVRREACAGTRYRDPEGANYQELLFSWQNTHERSPNCGARRVFQAVPRL